MPSYARASVVIADMRHYLAMATSRASRVPTHRVAVLLLEDTVPLDAAIPLEVFLRAAQIGLPYRSALCGSRAGVGPFGIWTAAEPLRWASRAHTIIVPGRYASATPVAPEVLELLRRAHARGARIASICAGAYVLAAAGLLDGRHATAHWHDCPDLQRRYPQVQVDPRPLFIDDGDVLTSAGLAAGLDLCLHIVRVDAGASHASRLGRALVFGPLREGGQAQYIKQPVPAADDGSHLREWMLAHLAEPMPLRELAARAHVSTRTLLRRFKAETGQSPHQWLIAQRINAACALLEEQRVSIETVAARTGFSSAATLRLHFRRHLGLSPQSYRAGFSGSLRHEAHS